MGLSPKWAAAIIGLCSWLITATSVPDTTLTSVLCNSGVYSKGDPFSLSLDYVVSDLESMTPKSKNYDYYNISPYPNAFAYGHAACNKTLTSPDCKTCLGSAKTTMIASCPSRIGARSVLHDCNIRYEQYPFTDN